MDFKELMQSKAYDFLRTNPRLGDRIMLLGLGGSYAYGTNNENSDIDFRGVTLPLPSDLLGLTEFEQYEDGETDTVIYSFNKIVKLLLDCNPNTCEILGLDEEQYLIKSPLGQELVDNSSLFLSSAPPDPLAAMPGPSCGVCRMPSPETPCPKRSGSSTSCVPFRMLWRILSGNMRIRSGKHPPVYRQSGEPGDGDRDLCGCQLQSYAPAGLRKYVVRHEYGGKGL